MKKLISVISALSLAASLCAVPALAEDDLSEVVIEVKTRAEIGDEYTDFSNHISAYDDFTVYSLNWQTEDRKKWLDVEYNSDGVITEYSSYTEDNGYKDMEVSLPKITADEALSKAQEFVDKLNPESKGEFCVEASKYYTQTLSSNYRFQIKRLKNGIPVYGNTGRISVDRMDGSVNDMYISYTHISDFAPLDANISKAEAQKKYAENLGLELVYRTYFDDNKKVVYPAYVDNNFNKYIDARDGSVYDASKEIATFAKYSTADAAAEFGDAGGGGMTNAASRAQLSEVEIKELDKIAGLISKSDIEAQVRANKLFDIPKDLPLMSINLSRDYYDDTHYTYSMSFYNFDDGSVHISASADAKTGEIISYSKYGRTVDYGDDAEIIDEEKVKTDAESVFKALASDKKSEFEYGDCTGRYVSYNRIVNGIKMTDDSASIGFSKDGELLRYNINYTTNVDFPSIDKAMSAEEAAQKLFEGVDYEKVYYTELSDDKKTVAVPLYILGDFSAINPFTGKHVDYRNEEIKNAEPVKYSDIDKHYAKNQIETLAECGIAFEDSKFRPDEKITQKDFLYLVMKVSSNSYFADRDDICDRAERLGYITSEERDENAEVTREMAAKIMVRLMGGEKFAKHDDIFVMPFKDVTENKGYIAILSAMKIANGDGNGNFNPKNSLTRAEAACLIYNYLNR